MTKSEQDHASRAIACKGWRWMPGMLIRTVYGVTDRIAGIDDTHIHAWAESQQTDCPRGMWIRYRRDRMKNHGVPDLTDPATLGCLLALVREAWDDPHAYVLASSPDWYTMRSPNGSGGWLGPSPIDGSTEAAALVCALESAPSRAGGEE